MRLIMVFLLLFNSTIAIANPMDRIAEARAERIRIKEVQAACEQNLQEYITYSRWNRRNLAEQSWDRPGGFVDPSAINRARYVFQDISRALLNKIDQVQRSSNPDARLCRMATDRAKEEHWRYTCEILVPNDPACTGKPSYPEYRQH